jgi:hypothetical protein
VPHGSGSSTSSRPTECRSTNSDARPPKAASRCCRAERVIAPEGRHTPQEVDEATGLGLGLLERLRRAMGVPVPQPGERALTQGDLEAARAAARLLEAGISEERFLDLTRVMSRAMAAVAAAIVHTFGEAFIRAGDTERDAGLRLPRPYASSVRSRYRRCSRC